MTATTTTVSFPAAGTGPAGDLHLPAGAHGVVVFAHGGGSPCNRHVADELNRTEQVHAVVSLGGRSDLAGPALQPGALGIVAEEAGTWLATHLR